MRGLLNVQFADRRRRALRARGEPARVPHRAVRVEGARHPARQGGVAHHGRRHASRELIEPRACCPSTDGSRVPLDAPGRREGGRAAVQALPHQGGPHRRLGARPRDALDRRGHGHRPRLPDGVREEPGGRVRRHAAHRHRVRLGRRPRQARHRAAGAPPAAARLHHRRHRGHGRDPRPQRHRGARWCASTATTPRSRARRPSST